MTPSTILIQLLLLLYVSSAKYYFVETEGISGNRVRKNDRLGKQSDRMSKYFPSMESPDITEMFQGGSLKVNIIFVCKRYFFQETCCGIKKSSQIKDHLYRMVIVEVQQYLTKPNHCI